MVQFIFAFFLLAFVFTFLLCAITCVSCLGLTGVIKELVAKLGRGSYDRQYEDRGNSAPLNTECYICLERVRDEVVATCNHSYCAKCIIDYIRSKGDTAIECPACRRQVCVLMRRFNPTGYDQNFLKDKISEYNYKHSKEPNLWRSVSEIFFLVKQLPIMLSQDGIRYLLTNPRVKIILMMIVYTLSPLDLLPEAVLGPIGLLDDSAVVLNIVRQFSGMLVNFVSEESMRDQQRQGNPGRR